MFSWVCLLYLSFVYIRYIYCFTFIVVAVAVCDTTAVTLSASPMPQSLHKPVTLTCSSSSNLDRVFWYNTLHRLKSFGCVRDLEKYKEFQFGCISKREYTLFINNLTISSGVSQWCCRGMIERNNRIMTHGCACINKIVQGNLIFAPTSNLGNLMNSSPHLIQFH